MDSAEFANVFPLGSHLCREPMPAFSELKADMETLKRHGFNLIKLQEHWQIDEPAECHCDFSRYQELIEYAGKLDMGVYLGLTCEQAPHWLYEKYPDCRMVDRNGRTIFYESPTTLPADGKPGPCFDHPGAKSDQLVFIRKLVETLGQYENIVVWNTWQEIGYWAEEMMGESVCFCRHTLAFFQEWLKIRYHDLDTLNRLWNTRYSSWQSILPSLSSRLKQPQAVDIHWRYFMDNIQVSNVLRTRAETIKAADPLHRPVFAHKGTPIFGSGQDWSYARTQDFLGSSCYPAWGCGQSWDDGFERPFERDHALKTEMWTSVILLYDYIRSASVSGKPVWAAEFQGGPVSTGFQKGRVPSGADIRRWMLAAVSSGITGLSFWVTRAEIMAAECNGFGLLDSTGETSERLGEAGHIGRALNRHADIFASNSLQPAEVGILVNEWNYQFCTSLVQGGEHLAYSLRGWHRLLWEQSIPFDFVDLQYDAEKLKQYKVLILPFPLSISEAAALVLRQYVNAGGCLISEAAPGYINETGFCNRGEISPQMAELFGVQPESFTMVREPDNGSRWSPPERTWGEYREECMLDGCGPLSGYQLRANVYVQTYNVTDSDPVMCVDGRIAGVRRHEGKGCAWLLGTYAGHNGTAYRSSEVSKTVRRLLEINGVMPEYDGRLILRKRVLPDKEAWIFCNPTGDPITEQIEVSGFSKVEDLLSGNLQQVSGSVKIIVDPIDLRVLVLYK